MRGSSGCIGAAAVVLAWARSVFSGLALPPPAPCPWCKRGERELLLGQLLDQGERLLKLVLAALERLKLGALARQRRDELADLRVLGQRDLAQVLDVLLSLELVRLHPSYRSHRAICDKRFRDDDLRR